MIRLAQITDTHWMPVAHEALHGIDTDRSLEGVLALLEPWQPDLIVASGDLSEHGDAASYQRLAARLRRLTAPVYVLPGNHDDAACLVEHMPGDNVHHAFQVDLGSWALLLLDSSVPGEQGGRLSESSLRKVDQALEATAGTHQLVFVHHPPVPVGSPWLDVQALDQPEQLMDRLQGSGTQAVICGHVHQEHQAQWGEITVLTSPSTCSQATPGQDRFVDDSLGPGFRWFELHDDGRWTTGVIRVDACALEFAPG